MLLISILTLVDATSLKAQFYSVNFDYQTIAAMVGGYATEAGTELLHRDNTEKIAESYGYSEVATAGIFASKLLDRNALKSSKGFGDPDENYYYRKIYRLVANKIIPRTISVTKKLVRDPSTAIYWGSHLMRVMADTKSLCNQFSAVCTNSTLNFNDINFLEFTGVLQNAFNLQGITDFTTLFENIADIGQNFTTENVESEFDNLQNMAVGLASAGSSDITNLFNGSAFDGTFKDNISKITDKAQNYSTMWNQLQSTANNTLSSLISGDPTDMTKIFSTSNGTGSNWISSYNSSSDARYYTQRVYIYHVDSGSETLCQYDPPTDNDNILNGDHYTRFSTDQQYYTMSTAERQQALQNSYNHAGWSQDMVNQKNAEHDGYTYSMSTTSHGYSCYHTKNGNFNGYYAYAIAYSITVTRSWYNKTVYYEDTFDSYSMDWTTFMNVMQAKLEEANRNEEGIVYRIGYDSMKYYTASDARKTAGASLATFTANCSSSGNIVDGKIQYACSDCGSYAFEHGRVCSMWTSLVNLPFDYTEINDAISSTESQMEDVQKQIDEYNARNKEILNKLSSASSDEATALRNEYQHNRNEISTLQTQYDSLSKNLEDYKSAKQQAMDFDNSRDDSADHIPGIMHDLQKNFSLEWIDEGQWVDAGGRNDPVWERKAKMKNLNSIVTFHAEVTVARKPVYFLFFRIHWPILKITWELTAEYNDSEVLETMQLDPDGDQNEQANKVNQKLSELRQAYPDCEIEVSYDRSSSVQKEDDGDDDKVHLIWASDRLDVAREVCHRLEAIYVDLVVLDKYLTYRYSILDWLQDMTVNRLHTEKGRRLTIAERSRKRWMHNGGSEAYIREEEDDNYDED